MWQGPWKRLATDADQNNARTDIISLHKLLALIFTRPAIAENGLFKLTLTLKNIYDKMGAELLINNKLLPTPQGVIWELEARPPFGFKEFGDQYLGFDHGYLNYDW